MIKILGDADGDGRITMIDVIVALQSAAGQIPYIETADLNQDGIVSISEVRDMLKHLSGEKLIFGVIE
jgi:Ca2+-binding EF-hand superfamily protein